MLASVELEHFRSLHRLTYTISRSRDSGVIFASAAKQLSLLSSPVVLSEVCLNVPIERSWPIGDNCRSIDSILIGDNFPLLRRVELHQSIPFQYFPGLKEQGLLHTYTYDETLEAMREVIVCLSTRWSLYYC